jgi:Iap family predicted aminopeptidase
MGLKVDQNWTEESPYERFFDFIAPEADRLGILMEHSEKLGLNSIVISIEENRHFFIFPQGTNLKFSVSRTFPFRGKSPVVLTAHYDRVSGSPGANDNSAAVFQLLKAALRLDKLKVDNWFIIFTDKEELQSGESISAQGSYGLAKNLRKWGLSGANIFNFDTCGTGDTFVFSNTVDYLLKKNKRAGLRRASQKINYLRERALEIARRLHLKVLLAPTPFSDDAGFLQGGIPAQTVTMLPTSEAGRFDLVLRKRQDFADLLISGLTKNSIIRRLIPETWRCLNSPMDNHLRLTPKCYEKIVRFAVEICRER